MKKYVITEEQYDRLVNLNGIKLKTESTKEIDEDLGKWFKEKWVDVSKKVDGKHPPCGRKDANGKAYPKCRPSKKVSKETPKLASSYSKDEKKSMTQQKRRAEKNDPKIGKGNKPTITKFDEGIIKSPYRILVENLSPTIRRRLPFDNFENDLEWGILDEMNPCDFDKIGEFISEACDRLKDMYLDDVLDSTIASAKDKDELYYYFVDRFSNYLVKEYKRRCGVMNENDVEDSFYGSVEETNFVVGNLLMEAEYQGKKVTLNKPFYTPDGPKKRSVYVKNGKGNVVKVNFGDPNMKIKKSSPSHRKSFRARHNCQNPGPKDSAKYWSCRAW
jgi:hypothetical protein